MAPTSINNNIHISSYGRVRNKFGIVRTPSRDRYGYPVFGTTHREKKMAFFVHQVQGVAFDFPRKPGQNSIDHITGLDDEYPNRIDNLRYANPTEQANNRTCPENRLSGKQLNEPYILDNELWKPISVAGYRKYFVSNYGRFRNKMSPTTSYTPFRSGEYKRFRLLSDNGILWQPFVSVIIADTFLPRPTGWDSTWEVNHKDLDTTNNAVSNLEWITPAGNKLHSQETNKTRIRGGTKTNKPFRGKFINDEDWEHYNGINDAIKRVMTKYKITLHNPGISGTLNRKYKQTKGFVFEYTEPNEVDTLSGEIWVEVKEWMLDKQRMITSGEYDKMFVCDIVQMIKSEFT
uniref:HNH nuclease domain-containing protein n=1 Tax=viral metagenome TaxID=1070528 RepID=A0A6C0LSH8_9ZZZZ